MRNQLLESGFLDDQALSGPLPTEWLQLPAAALTKRRWSWCVSCVLVMAGFAFLQWWRDGHWFILMAWACVALGFLLRWFWLPLQCRHFRYLLRTQDFLLQSGVIWHKAVLIPLQRVQHVSLSQGPLQKRFGLATLKVFTAGGLDAEAALADIELSVAQALREQLARLIPQGDLDVGS